jgi:uncharacterized iron-regulated membrane protein
MKLQTRRERAMRQNLKRAGIWAFLFLFSLSVVGGIALLSISK